MNETTTAQDTGVSPHVKNRILAGIIDGIVVGVTHQIIIEVLVMISPMMLFGVLFRLLQPLIFIAYQVGMLTQNNGQTVGKLVMKLRVTNEEGKAPTVEKALYRSVASLVTIFTLIFSDEYRQKFTKENRLFHDYQAGTKVEEVTPAA